MDVDGLLLLALDPRLRRLLESIDEGLARGQIVAVCTVDDDVGLGSLGGEDLGVLERGLDGVDVRVELLEDLLVSVLSILDGNFARGVLLEEGGEDGPSDVAWKRGCREEMEQGKGTGEMQESEKDERNWPDRRERSKGDD